MPTPQPITQAYQPGRTVYALIYDMTKTNIWDVVGSAWVTFNLTNIARYQYTLTDVGGNGWYYAAIPTPLIGLTLQIVTYDSANPTQPIGATEMEPGDTGGLAFVPIVSNAVVDVVNKALFFLGVGTISSLDEDSEAANRANQIYAGVLDATLRSHYWKFATYVEIPALISAPAFDSVNDGSGNPVPGWEYLYAYPSQCLMLRRLFNASACGSAGGVGFVSYTSYPDFVEYYDMYKDVLFRFQVMQVPGTFQKCIASHINPVYLEYTYRVADPSMWDQYFYDAMSLNLAAQLARTLTGNTELGSQAQQQFLGVVSEAKRLDAQEDRNTYKRMSSYQRSRM